VKAIAVIPGRPNSMHLRDVPEPKLSDVPDGRGVLVKVLRVGVDGTDKEINAAEYGQAPPGDEYLITGHESFGQVVETGPNVPDTLRPGAHVVASVRRPGGSIYDRIGMQDMTTDDVYYERGINLLHGYLTEYYVDDAAYLVPLPDSLREVGVLLEPLTVSEKGINQAFEIQRRLRVWQPRRAAVTGAGTIGLLAALALRLRGLDVTCLSRRPAPYRNSDLVEAIGARYVSTSDTTIAQAATTHGPFDLIFEATGFSPLAFEAAAALGKNGVLVLSSVTGGDRTAEIPADRINQGFVLGNKVMVGTVNASRADFLRGVDDLIKAESVYPGWLVRLLTTPIKGLENWPEMLRALNEDREAIKVFVEVCGVARPPAGRGSRVVRTSLCQTLTSPSHLRSNAPACGTRPRGGRRGIAGGRTWPNGSGARCARTIHPAVTPGTAFPMTMHGRAPIAGARMGCWASPTIAAGCASRSRCGTRPTPSSRSGCSA
jgi:threonine dehydrogenase-like Zn-dependent dehydrogenase